MLLLLAGLAIGASSAPGSGTGTRRTTWPGPPSLGLATLHPNPGSPGGEFTVTVRQEWSQEPQGYDRTAEVKVPTTSAGQKLPMVLDLHGSGGQGHVGRLGYLGDSVVIVAPSGYERSWNINNEKSKADDVTFLLELIALVTADYPAADAEDVTVIGTSNGAAMVYRLLIVTGRDRPFHRVIPMVSSLISPQWHDGLFWKSGLAPGMDNDYTAPTALEFAEGFQYMHLHGTEDHSIPYYGASPGPPFLGEDVDVIAAQKTDYLFAEAMGHMGGQLEDGEGVPGEGDCSSFVEYSYLGGLVKHVKVVGGSHGSVFGEQCTRELVVQVLGV